MICDGFERRVREGEEVEEEEHWLGAKGLQPPHSFAFLPAQCSEELGRTLLMPLRTFDIRGEKVIQY